MINKFHRTTSLLMTVLFFLTFSAFPVLVVAQSRDFPQKRIDPEKFTGNDLFALCEAEDDRQVACWLVIGDTVFEKTGILIRKADGTKCYPEGFNLGQGIDIVRKYLKENPEIRHLNGYQLVLRAILRAFPECTLS